MCLGAQCFALDRLSLADADQIKAALSKNSWPLAYASTAAVALYQSGFQTQARAVLRMYGGLYGVKAIGDQINRIYNGSAAPVLHATGYE